MQVHIGASKLRNAGAPKLQSWIKHSCLE